MNPERYELVSELFQKAVELDQGERAGFLAGACGDDDELRAAVEELLRHDSTSVGDPFDESSLRDARELVDAVAASGASSGAAERPEAIGRYRVLRLLGEGGMGSVYLCQQSEPVERQVAVKLIKRGMDSERIVRHFAREREALQRMEHPNIARMLDAGTTEDGRSFFAMEYVDGQGILEACDERKSSIRQRLQVFVKVARAIQHAHQRGILHRDIKPSNVQATVIDGELIPKVIDFGLARALDPELAGDASLAGARVVGTPAYMSPEQADPRIGDVDSRADVYSLGVLLYELVTGHLPFDHNLGHLVPADSEDSASGPMVTPSSRFALRGRRPSELAAKRGSGSGALHRALKGDLDWIVMMALDADRDRRYSSAAELANDVLAFLDDQPVQAGPPTAAYRIGKLYKRHRAIAWGAIAIVALLVVGLVVTSRLTLRAKEAEHRAMALLEDVRGQNDIFNHMLITSDPRYGGRDARFADVIERGVEYTLEKYSDQPRVAGVTLLGLGATLRELGDIERARDILLQGYEFRKQSDGVTEGELSQATNSLGLLFKRAGELEEAKHYYRASLAHAEAVPNPDDDQMRSIAATNYNLARLFLYTGDVDAAEPFMLRAVELQEQYSPDDDEVLTYGNGGLAELYERQGDFDRAVEYFGLSVLHARRAFPEDHPHLATALVQQGFLLQRLDRLEEAHGPLRESLDIARRAYAPGSASLKVYTSRLAFFELELGNFEEAEALMAETRSLSNDSLVQAESAKFQGLLHMARNEYTAAEEQFTRALELLLSQVIPDSAWTDELDKLIAEARAAQ